MIMANRSEQERAELHRTIWGIANDLRGSVDGWDFKQYVLGMLFYRYISENLLAYINRIEWETGNTSFNYANLSDQKQKPLAMTLSAPGLLYSAQPTL
jgi:type I restriction enzyme M protein